MYYVYFLVRLLPSITISILGKELMRADLQRLFELLMSDLCIDFSDVLMYPRLL